ncbi:MAG TPA: cysteine dioxygenase family protein [Solirubrobacteraceae bacterium]
MAAIPGAPWERDLEVCELREVVARIAADPASWRPLVHADTAAHHFEQLWLDDHVGAWVITWARGNDTGFHDHDVSCGAVAVVLGAIVEERLVVGGPPQQLPRRAGEAFGFDASHVHRMRKDDDALAVSIHAYSPPLSRMGAYEVDADGALRRRSISSAEELRPAGAVA